MQETPGHQSLIMRRRTQLGPLFSILKTRSRFGWEQVRITADEACPTETAFTSRKTVDEVGRMSDSKPQNTSAESQSILKTPILFTLQLKVHFGDLVANGDYLKQLTVARRGRTFSISARILGSPK